MIEAASVTRKDLKELADLVAERILARLGPQTLALASKESQCEKEKDESMYTRMEAGPGESKSDARAASELLKRSRLNREPEQSQRRPGSNSRAKRSK